MRKPEALFPIALALCTTMLVPRAGAQPTAISACPFTASQPGSYVLVSALTSTGNCITIAADFVTVNLDGFSITGNGSGTAIRVMTSGVTPRRGLEVRNGSIANFDNGVDIAAATSIVEGLRVSGSIHDAISANGIVRGNLVQENGQFGIIVGTGTVTNNVALSSDIGISVNAGTVSWNVAGEILAGNRIGIVAGFEGRGATLIGNTAVFNTDVGISVSCPSNLTDNTAANNGTNLVFTP